METFIIVFVFGFCPLALFSFIIWASVRRAKQRKILFAAAEKYLNS
jgi:hypothetical protein